MYEFFEVAKLTAGYGSRPIVSSISLNLKALDVAIIVGPNGSGKSTFLKALFGTARVLSFKHVAFRGKAIDPGVQRGPLVHDLAMVPQSNNVFESMTVRENIAMASEIVRDADSDAIFELIFDCLPDLKGIQKKPASLLSGGQRQQLALALGLSRKPELIFLDEPLAGLDPLSARRFVEVVRELNEIQKISFLIVEHRFKYLIDLMTKLIGFRQGEKVVDLRCSGEHSVQEKLAVAETVFFPSPRSS